MADYPSPQALEAVQDTFRDGKSKWDWTFGLTNPSVPHPSMFQADPPVVGDEMLQMLAQRLMDLDPRTKQNISRIVQGPTNGSIQTMRRDGENPLDYDKSRLMGSYDPKQRDISINPSLKGDVLFETLAHEMAHAAGQGEKVAYGLDDVLVKMRRK
jgi:hypothetical protein